MNHFHTRIVLALCFLTLFVSVSWAGANAAEFYVAADGNDSHDGSRQTPFQTLGKAQQAVRTHLKETPGQPVTVYIRGGDYNFESPAVFTTDDSGTEQSPVVYRAADGEKPVFTGGVPLKNWQRLSEPEKLALLPAESRGSVYVTDLKAAGIGDFGDATDIGKRPDLYCNGQLQTLARWPNEGFTKAGKVKGQTVLPATYAVQHGTAEGIFDYTDERQDRWAKETDVRLGGFWYWDWSDEYQKADRIDTALRTVYLKEPYHGYGYRDGLIYFGLNLFCEIDAPAEWYLDRTDGRLYWFPRAGVNPNQATVTLSVFSAPFMVELKNVSHLTLRGLGFQESRGSGVLISGGQHCRIDGCRLERFGRDGIHIEGGTNHAVSGCLLRTFGCGGIKLKGGDRKTLTPGGHVVDNTIVEHFSLFKRTYEPAVLVEGCGLHIHHNRFRFSSSSAMRLEGNDLLIEYNEISHVVSESDDQGGIDTWYNPSYRGIAVRYNRWSDISGGTRHGAAGVRLDDMISGVLIYGNLFERCGSRDFGGVQIHGGKDNRVENNVFYDCHAAVSFSSWGPQRWLEHLDSPAIKKKLYEDVDIGSETYQTKYPELKDIRLNADVNFIRNNLLIGCKQDFLRRNDGQVTENNPALPSDGKPVEAFCKPEFLKGYGLEPIAVNEIGPKNNVWSE